MRVRILRLAAILVALFLLAAGSASARNLSLDDRDIAMRWARLSFISSFEELISVSCTINMIGSFHASTFAKSAGSLVGINALSQLPTNCAGGTATVPLASMPWHLTYDSFAGSLPSIAAVRLNLIGFTALLRREFFGCELDSTTLEPVPIDLGITGGVITSATIDPDAVINAGDLGEETLCDAAGITWTMSGTAAVEDGSRGTVAITLT